MIIGSILVENRGCFDVLETDALTHRIHSNESGVVKIHRCSNLLGLHYITLAVVVVVVVVVVFIVLIVTIAIIVITVVVIIVIVVVVLHIG